jgi:hypothetical protein
VPDRHSHILEGIFDVFNYFGSKEATMNPQAARNTISESFAKWNHELALHREDNIRRGTIPSEAEVIELRLADEKEDEDLLDKVHQMSLMQDEASSACGPSKMGGHMQGVLRKSVAEIITDKPHFRSISPELKDPSWVGSGVLEEWNTLRQRHLKQVSLQQEQ